MENMENKNSSTKDSITQEVKAIKRVLVVDDEAAFLAAIKKIIERPGIHVDTAETQEAAIELLSANSYEFAVLDLRLSGMVDYEGIEILKHLRQLGLQTKTMLLTGYGNPEIMQKARDLGADYYFEKPINSVMLKIITEELGVV